VARARGGTAQQDSGTVLISTLDGRSLLLSDLCSLLSALCSLLPAICSHPAANSPPLTSPLIFCPDISSHLCSHLCSHRLTALSSASGEYLWSLGSDTPLVTAFTTGLNMSTVQYSLPSCLIAPFTFLLLVYPLTPPLPSSLICPLAIPSGRG
jgi:hypothetical protein